MTAQSSPAANAAVFAAALQSEREALGAFVNLLQAEQAILVDGDADRLAALTPEKATQLDLLTALGKERKRNLNAQNLDDSADGMLTWLSRNSGFSAAVRKIWQELLTRAETARQLNETNGRLIEERLQHNRLKLAVLQTGARSDGVYRPDGQLRPMRSTRSFNLA